MKPIVPVPPPGPYPLRYNPLPDHTQLPDREGGKPLRPPPGPAPDHTTLPDRDGTFVRNSYEHWQSHLLTDSLLPVADAVFPEGNYFIGEDCGIYWRVTDPPERGAKAPDWYFVPAVPRLLDEQMRRSYVMWREGAAPLVILEYISGDGAEERDRTPNEGKFWAYEHPIRADYYGIFDPNSGTLEFYSRNHSGFRRAAPNKRGHYAIPYLRVELGVWQGAFAGFELGWLRWWDAKGNLLLTGTERAANLADKAERLAAKLRELGVDPNAV
jgi:Uma2 family endonuclease